MRTKELGKTGVQIPEIGIGTWNYHAGADLLRQGVRAGAAFIDTAESYGTEAVVGEALKGLDSPVFVATKVSPANFRREDLLRAADRSLQELKIDRIDLYQLHAPNREIPIEETLGAMEELVDAGKVRFIGVSNFGVKELQAAQKALRRHPIVANQVRFSIIDRTIETDLLPYCESQGITVIAYSPLGREVRRLSDSDPSGVLPTVAAETGRTVAQVALNWCLTRAGVVVIPKGNSSEHIVENCGASDWRLTPEQVARLDAGVKFRRRSRAEMLLRRLVSGGMAPFIKKCIRFMPRSIRRRLS